MSVWTAYQQVSQAFGKWPNPFRGQARRVRELACNDGWLADIEFNGRIWGNFFWTDFVPQPWEIVRKSTTGAYKCGFFLLDELPSPLDIIWRDGSGSRFLAKIAHFPVTGLFFWWAGETAIDALNTWSSVMMMEAACKEPDATCTLFLGSAFTGVDGPGSIAQYAEGWGNPEFYDKDVGAFNIPTDGGSVNAFGTVQVANREVDNIKVGYTPIDPVTGFPNHYIDLGAPSPGSNVSWATPAYFLPTGGHVSVAIYVKFKAGSAGFGVTFNCGAFCAFFGPRAHDDHDGLPTPSGEQEYCLPY